MRFGVVVLLGLYGGFGAGLSSAAAPLSDPRAIGAAIYRQGVLPGGTALVGKRAGTDVTGADAACVNCHRRSGLGSVEGQIVVPPITGRYLFQTDVNTAVDRSALPARSYVPSHGAYTDASLARAIREGIGADGRKLNYLMPAFTIDDAAMAGLIAYLKGLTQPTVPGVGDDTLHFATIITADADPIKAQGMIDVLERFFADKNEFIRGGARRLQSSREITYRVTRKWQLHVWRTTGAPSTWEAQLHQQMLDDPVFAVVAGLGGRDWAPVHAFCEHDAVPCLFPNVDLPVADEHDFYPVYFSKGVLLEADVIAQGIREQLAHNKPRRVLQVFQRDDIGATAAAALRKILAPSGLNIVDHVIANERDERSAAQALRATRDDDMVVLWLRPAALAALPPPGKAAAVYVSGLMGGLEHAPLPSAWRTTALMTYPFDLPLARKLRMNYPLGWFRIRQVTLVDERVQSDTYLACGILSETLNDMLDNFVRDYLVERIESMLSRRVITGYYPRLGLAPGQRFASKGAYFVRFTEPQGSAIVTASPWMTP